MLLGKLKNGLPSHLTYHNIDHTLDVIQAAESMANSENIGGHEKELLLTAALFHDSGFLKLRDGHEVESCNNALQYLPAYGYDESETGIICQLIMATRLPQSPQNLFEEILCDADLNYLGRDDFFNLSERLYTELKLEGLINDEDEWNRQQADFIGNHQYFIPSAKKMLQAKQQQHVNLIKAKILTPIVNENQ